MGFDTITWTCCKCEKQVEEKFMETDERMCIDCEEQEYIFSHPTLEPITLINQGTSHILSLPIPGNTGVSTSTPVYFLPSGVIPIHFNI